MIIGKYRQHSTNSVVLHRWERGQTHGINIFLGTFTTAHACLELYELMDKLGDRLLYADSVIFTSREGDWKPLLDPYLGNLTDEIGESYHIIEFCSGARKHTVTALLKARFA